MSWFTKDNFFKGIGGAALAVGGFFFHDLIDFRNKQNEATNAVIESVKSAGDDVSKLMLRFDKAATEGTPIKPEDRQAFNEAIVKAYSASERLKHHIPSIDPAVETYEMSLIDLKKGAEVLQGPATGRSYVEAASRYLLNQDELEKSVAENKRSYVRMLIFNEV